MTDTPIRAKARDWRINRLGVLAARYNLDARDESLGSLMQSEACAYAISLQYAIDALLREADPPAGETPKLSCREPAPDRSGRQCDKPKGHDGPHWTYGGHTLTWPAASPTLSDPPAGETPKHSDAPCDCCPDPASPTLSEPPAGETLHSSHASSDGRSCLRCGAVAEEVAGKLRCAVASPTLSEPELTHEEQCAYGEMEQHNVLMRRRAPVSPAAQPEEQYDSRTNRVDRSVLSTASSDLPRTAVDQPQAEVTPLPVRQRIEQDTLNDACVRQAVAEAAMLWANTLTQCGEDPALWMEFMRQLDLYGKACKRAAASEALIILRQQIDAVHTHNRAQTVPGYRDGLLRVERLINNLLSSLTDQETP